MKKTITIILIGGLVSAGVFASCKTKKIVAKSSCTTPDVSFAADVKPLIDENCANSCHSAKKKARGIDLSTYELVKSAAGDKSFLGSIKHESGYAPMPKNHPKLDDASIQKISCWVDNGFKQ